MDETTLAELLTFTRDGEWGKGEPTEGYSPALVIRGTDFEKVRYGVLDGLPLRYIRSDILERKRVRSGDTIIESAGGTKDQPTGRTVLIEKRVTDRALYPLICASFSRSLRPNVRDHLELKYGKSLPARDRSEGNFPVYGSGGQTGWHNKAIVKGPATIVGRKGTVGSLFWEERDCFPIDTAFYVEAKQSLVFCYELLASFPLNDMNTDAAVPGLNRENVYRLTLANPPEQLILAFDTLAGDIRSRIRINSQQSNSLAQTRDTILPKLMAGAIRVRDAESAVAALC